MFTDLSERFHINNHGIRLCWTHCESSNPNLCPPPYAFRIFGRASGTYKQKSTTTPYERRKQLKEQKKELQNRQAALLELIKDEKREKRRRREQAKAAKADNQKRNQIVQVVRVFGL